MSTSMRRELATFLSRHFALNEAVKLDVVRAADSDRRCLGTVFLIFFLTGFVNEDAVGTA